VAKGQVEVESGPGASANLGETSMARLNYSRPLDLLLASVAAYQRGKQTLASKLFVKACSAKSIRRVVAALDKMNSTPVASAEDRRWRNMAKAIAAAAEKIKADEAGDDDDLGLEDLDLSEDADALDSDGGGDADIDDLLDGIDDGDEEISESEDKEDKDKDDDKDDKEKAGEILDVSTEPDDPEYTHEETPAKDKNEPAKALAKMRDKKAIAIAHNLKELSRLLKS
jgi:hypothetical protein